MHHRPVSRRTVEFAFSPNKARNMVYRCCQEGANARKVSNSKADDRLGLAYARTRVNYKSQPTLLLRTFYLVQNQSGKWRRSELIV